MSPNSPHAKLPKDCKRELRQIHCRNSLLARVGWKPKLVSEHHVLHYFISEKYFADGGDNEKPYREAFGSSCISVRAGGGDFLTYDRFRLALELVDFSSERQLKFVGVVALSVVEVQQLGFQIKHDPFPYRTRSAAYSAQAHNHFQIICKKKSTAIQKRFQQISDWALSPEELAKTRSTAKFRILYPIFRLWQNGIRLKEIILSHVCRTLWNVL